MENVDPGRDLCSPAKYSCHTDTQRHQKYNNIQYICIYKTKCGRLAQEVSHRTNIFEQYRAEFHWQIADVRSSNDLLFELIDHICMKQQ